MAAAQAFLRSARAATGVTPERVTTDGHCSYPRAIRSTLGRRVVHRTSAYKNKRCSTWVWGAPESDGADYIMFPGLPRALAEFKALLSRSPHSESEQRLKITDLSRTTGA